MTKSYLYRDSRNEDFIRERLIQKRQSLAHEFPIRETSSELNSIDHHPADLASDLYERSKDIAFHEQIRFQLQRIDQAIQRLENGAYGICSICDQPIEHERLDALPEATTCRTHADEVTNHHLQRERPVEEDVLSEWRAERRRYAAVYGLDNHAFIAADDDVHHLIIEQLRPDGQLIRTQEEAIWTADLHGNPIESPAGAHSKPFAFELDLDDFDQFGNVIADDRQVERSQFF